jgi:hypothetical protein
MVELSEKISETLPDLTFTKVTILSWLGPIPSIGESPPRT